MEITLGEPVTNGHVTKRLNRPKYDSSHDSSHDSSRYYYIRSSVSAIIYPIRWSIVTSMVRND